MSLVSSSEGGLYYTADLPCGLGEGKSLLSENYHIYNKTHHHNPQNCIDFLILERGLQQRQGVPRRPAMRDEQLQELVLQRRGRLLQGAALFLC